MHSCTKSDIFALFPMWTIFKSFGSNSRKPEKEVLNKVLLEFHRVKKIILQLR